MFNNVALDIAIGLTFIFVLYSLLAMTINEFIATIFAYRHRMLERGLEQMLDGRSYGYYWWDKILNVFIWLNYLRKNKKLPKPNLEIKSLNAFLSKTDLGNPEVDKADGTTEFFYHRLKVNKKSALFTANITDHPLYKRKSERSLLFKKPAYLSADSFSDILIDVLGEDRNTGSPILMKNIADFVNTKINDNPDLKKVLTLYIEQANGDLQRFKLLLENWFDDTMDRVSGWYKKQSYKISIMIGFLLAMTFNVSTIQIVKKLSKDKVARAALVENASAYVKKHLIDMPPEKKDSCVEINDSLGKRDTCFKKANNDADDFAEAKKKLRQIDSLYKTDIAQNDSILGLGWGDYGLTKRKKDYTRDSSDYASGKTSKKPKKPKTPHDKTDAGKILYVICRTFSSPVLLLGFLITAFAISLGAPFWFDLLNKFINLRVSGAKPDDKSSAPATKTALLNKKPDPTAKG
jgi:hypothetical protein